MWRTLACRTIARLTPQAFATCSSVPPFSFMNLAIQGACRRTRRSLAGRISERRGSAAAQSPFVGRLRIFCQRGATGVRAIVSLATILDGNRYFNPTMPLPEAVCHGLGELLNRLGETFSAFDRAKDFRHLLLGELEQRTPVALAQLGGCRLTVRRNFARLVQ